MKNCVDKRLCNSNLAPESFTETLSSKIRTYVQIGPINHWHKRFKHLVNSRRMEKPLNGTGDRPHIVRGLAGAESKVRQELCTELQIQHIPDFELTPGQKQVVSQDIKYGKPRKPDVLYTYFVFGSC